MKKLIVFAFSLWVCCLTMTAQNVSLELANRTFWAAMAHYKEGKYQEALSGFLKVGDYTKNHVSSEERQLYVASQIEAAACYKNLKRYEEGFLLGDGLIQSDLDASEKSILLEHHLENGFYLVLSLNSREQYVDAGRVLKKMLPYANGDMTLWIQHNYPIMLYRAGQQFQLAQNYRFALEYMEEACMWFHRSGILKNEMKAWNEIGDIKKSLYDAFGAMEAYRQAGILARTIQNEDTLMLILIKQYRTSEELGDSKMTQELSSKIDSLADATVDNAALRQYYNFLGDKAKAQGNYSLAEHWYRRNEPNVDFSRLCYLYIRLGDFDDALKYAELDKMDLQSRLSEADGYYYLLPYMGIAKVYQHKGDSVKSFQAIDSLSIALDKFEEPRKKAEVYKYRGSVYSGFKEYSKALADYQTADEVLATKYGEDDGDRIMLLSMMGSMEHQLGHYQESEQLYWKYKEGIRNLKGEDKSDYIDALRYLANAEGYAGHIQEGCRDYMDAANRLKQQIREKMPYFTTTEREGYWKSVLELFHLMTPFALEAKECQSAFTEACYDGLVLEKAFLLASEQSTIDLIHNEGTEDDRRDFETIAAMRAQISEWERNEKEHVDSILYLTSKSDRLEAQLASRCRGFGDMTTFMDWDYQKVKEKVPDGDVLIDFTDFVKLNGERVYAAYVINQEQDYPLLKRLFAESTIDSMQIAYPDMYYESPYAKELYRLLWEPFQDVVKEGSTVYYVPSQLLFRIALESLPLEDGTVLGDHYRFIRLSSARELAYVDNRLNLNLVSEKTHAVLYGGLQYSLDDAVMVDEARKYDTPKLLASSRGQIRGGIAFNDLPGTKAEIDSVEKILCFYQLSVEPYSEERGTEESFLRMNGNAPQILHMATHGFYYTSDEAQEIDGLRGYKDAMLLSGLVMSGGNAAWLGQNLPEGVLGGILTASDIARLDLRGMELVVLPACHSGNGEATEEGLYGLQRAFKKAGVKTMVMSLWEVSDMVATEFMTCFYKNMLDKDNAFDKRKAFDKAKSLIREKYPEPYYWAGFVMLD